MIWFFFFHLKLSICSAVHIDRLPLYTDPIPGHRNAPTTRAANLTCSVSQAGPVCASDCRTFMVCDGNTQPAYNSSCAEMETNAPYCVGNTCSATPDPTNPACQVSFQCTSEGTFPGNHQ